MAKNSLDIFAAAASNDWGPLSTKMIAAMRRHMENLLRAAPTEAWLQDLHRDVPPSRELVRDARHGFVLQAHFEPEGLYRPPHDHGRNWVIYAVAAGESEMGSYARIEAADGTARLIRRGSTRIGPGQVRVYFPGDIHDTRCTGGPALLYRFTERDLKGESGIVRYVERDGDWVAP
ncbi:hypothetical protein [Ferrovibrio sp.]|uniref:hypothetical protein n=1 Tax=Ferrovibrio sp. TaxID=1917215 RepID=UPI003D2D1223